MPYLFHDPTSSDVMAGSLTDFVVNIDPTPEMDHQPSMAYVPYLVTGDRYYADEIAFWGGYCLATSPLSGASYWNRSGAFDDPPNGSRGVIMTQDGRGRGWGLRTVTDAAAYLPDDAAYGPVRNYLAEKVNNTLAWFGRHQTFAGPIGLAWVKTLSLPLIGSWHGFEEPVPLVTPARLRGESWRQFDPLRTCDLDA